MGKDSVRYCRKVAVHSQVYLNIKLFIEGKQRKDDLVTSSMLNEYLSSFIEDLIAKVWCTFNASLLFQKELQN